MRNTCKHAHSELKKQKRQELSSCLCIILQMCRRRPVIWRLVRLRVDHVLMVCVLPPQERMRQVKNNSDFRPSTRVKIIKTGATTPQKQKNAGARHAHSQRGRQAERGATGRRSCKIIFISSKKCFHCVRGTAHVRKNGVFRLAASMRTFGRGVCVGVERCGSIYLVALAATRIQRFSVCARSQS